MQEIIADIVANGPTIKNVICAVGPLTMVVLTAWMTGEIIASAVRAPQKN